MPRLSRPLIDLERRYKAVVVGTGYGGSVAAARLAAAFGPGSVCVLERGRERHPGEYPTNLWRARREFDISKPEDRRARRPGALFRLHAGPDVSVLVGSGLGGTSQINAGVALRPRAEVFRHGWPEALQQAGVLDQFFRTAIAMLGSTRYPDDPSGLAKYAALEASAAALGAEASTPRLNISFTAGMNGQGVYQAACTSCGNCVSGCNVGAKNTTVMNYLPVAVRHGARIFCEMSVRRIEQGPDGQGWLVHVQPSAAGRLMYAAPDLTIAADVVVLAAGTLGSTEILLRSAQAGLSLSPMVGRGFSTNGDLIGFAYAADQTIRGIGSQPNIPSGPTIVGVIDRRAKLHEQHGLNDVPHREAMVIEDGVIPGPLALLMPTAFALGAGFLGIPRAKRGAYLRRLPVELLRGAYRGATARTQTFLVMSIDKPDGIIELRDDTATVVWKEAALNPVFDRDSKLLQLAAAAIGGTYVPSPAYMSPLGRSLVTVHPLGGCPMADDARHGVVNHLGQVFRDDAGDAVHDGLFVADGAIVPTPLAVNPLLTITALAERICKSLVSAAP